MQKPPYAAADRRPMSFREWAPVRALAHGLARCGVSPNQISVASVGFAAVAGLCFVLTAKTCGRTAEWLWLAGGVGVALRALCNVLDGVVAMETGRASPIGELYNEVPDRFSDVFYLAGLGYAAGSSPLLGWIAAVAALLTAYVRVEAVVALRAAGLDGRQDFCGPMAKPHRMYVVMVLALWQAVAAVHIPFPAWGPGSAWGLPAVALGLISCGGLSTVARRLQRCRRRLGAEGPDATR